MKIALYAGQTAGLVVLTTLLALKHQITTIFPDDDKLFSAAELFELKTGDKTTLNNQGTIKQLTKSCDIFICCHGWKILSKSFVTSLRCINFHPCLYQYKGLHPITRLIKEKNSRASVATHWMTEEIDKGQTIVEEFVHIKGISSKTEADVYNELYPLYIKVARETLASL